MDDVAGKTRRNLLAFAAAIVAIGILDIPLDGKLVGAVDLRAVHPVAAWIAALAVLLYLHLRLLFEPKTRRVRKSLADKRRKKYNALLKDELQRALKAPYWKTLVTKFSLEKDDGPPKPGAVYSVKPQAEVNQRTQNKRQASATYFWFEPYREHPAYPKTDTYLREGWGTLEVCRVYAACLWCWSRITAVKPSWAMLEHFVPNALAVAAYAIGICHLWAAFFQSWPFAFHVLNA